MTSQTAPATPAIVPVCYDSRHEWPHPLLETIHATGRPDWVEVSEEYYEYSLEVLPPIYVGQGFMVSEPADHTAEGRPVYTGLVRYDGRYFARNDTRAGFQAAQTMLQVAVNGPAVHE